ncbi:MAG: ABC transporter substrate-binding protein [Cryobacterium sp.]|nr:ABC transporter substrate-binding protein [Cryobacterium sp.]
MKKIIRPFALIAAVTLVVTVSACTATTKDSGDVLRIGTTSMIDSLNPFVSDSDYSSVTYQYVYPHLTEYDADLNITPSFAESWETSADGKTWTFHTVANAKWSDGKSLSAKDAAFTYNMILDYQDGPTGILAGWVAHMESVKAVDANTLEISYEVPVGNVLTQLQALPILPEHIWSKFATGDGTEITNFENGAPMVSGGPFKLDKYQKDELALFSVNKNWWGKTKPQISGFGFQFFANDDAMVSALMNKQLDMIGQQTPPTAVGTLKNAGFKVLTGPSVTIKMVIINTNPEKTKNRELLDPKVREAIDYAIDRKQIVDTAWLGFADPGSTIVTPASGYHDESLAPLPFDVAKANALLDEAGYPVGENGIRVANGHPMSYDLIFPTEENGAPDRAFQIMQAGFKQIGIEIKQRKMDPDAAWEAIIGPNEDYGDYDIAMWNWTPPVDPDFVLSVLTCDQRGNNSDSGHCNPAYDELYLQQGAALDNQERRSIINQMQKIIYDDRPYIVYAMPMVIEAHSTQWDGFVLSPLVGSVNNLSTLTLLSVHKVP